MELEYKQLPLHVKAITDEGPGVLTGYGAYKGNVDRAGEVIADGAFKNLDDFVKEGFSAIGHDWHSLSIGTIESAKEDDQGLDFAMQFHSTPQAQDARTVVRERKERGKSVGLSIGYEVTEDAKEQRDGKEVRVLKGIKVYEISIVTVPANPRALASVVKGLLPDRKSVDDHASMLLAGNEDFIARVALFKEQRSQGLSEARIEQIHALRNQFDALVKACEPNPEPVEDGAVLDLMVQHLTLELAGVI